jgi:Sulfotransferase domain
MSLQVIGVGLHRTGSLSVKVALERLGFGPCYHGFEYVGRADQLAAWQEAFDRDGDVDWRRIFDEYRSAIDWPTIYFWDRVVEAHPQAKVLLTVRDSASWYDSHVASLQAIAELEDSGLVPDDPGHRALLLRALSATFSDRLFDRGHAIQVFDAHYRRVRETVPAERLLVYRPSDGWDPLCRFLGVDVPDEPFPRVNGRAEFRDNAYRAAARVQQKTDGFAWQ